MVSPGVIHIGKVAIVNTYPSIKYAGNNLQQKKDDQLGVAQARLVKQPDFCNQPGKQKKIPDKE